MKFFDIRIGLYRVHKSPSAYKSYIDAYPSYKVFRACLTNDIEYIEYKESVMFEIKEPRMKFTFFPI